MYVESVVVMVIYKRGTHINWFSSEMTSTFGVGINEGRLTLIIATSSIYFPKNKGHMPKDLPQMSL